MAQQNTKIKSIIYDREDNAGQGESLKILNLYCHNHGWTVVKTYEDQGPKPSRKTIKDLNRHIQGGSVNALVIHDLSALFESVTHAVKFLHQLRRKNVAFISLTDHVCITDENASLVNALLRLQSEKNRTSIRNGIAMARLKGRRIGRTPVVTPQLIDEVLKLRERHSIRTIEKLLNRRLSRSAIGRICSKKGSVK